MHSLRRVAGHTHSDTRLMPHSPPTCITQRSTPIAAHLRAKASEMRQAASDTPLSHVRTEYLDLARHYDQLADVVVLKR